MRHWGAAPGKRWPWHPPPPNPIAVMSNPRGGTALEWSEMYEGLRSLLAKLAKRDLRAAANGDDVREDAPGGAVESPGDLGLTASQMTHQNRILARRHRMQVPPKGE